MSNSMRVEDGAIQQAVGYVDNAQDKLNSQYGVIRGRVQAVGSNWQGQASVAFNQTMQAWEQQVQRITRALETFKANLQATDRDNAALEEQASTGYQNISAQLG